MGWFSKKKQPEPPAPEPEATGPHVEILGSSIDPEKGIKIELDWNKEFVDYLRTQNFTGSSDEQIVQKWLAMLTKSMAEDIGEQVDDFQ